MKAFPYGGRALWDMRLAKQRPDAMVLVSLVGPLTLANPQVWLGERTPEGLEWRFLVGLDVEVIADTTVPFQKVVNVVKIVNEHCAGLFLWWRDAGLRIVMKWDGAIVTPRAVDYDMTNPKVRSFSKALIRKLRLEFPT